MKKIICKREYDTENAQILKKTVFGNFGDSDGYEETLFVTPDGYYFMYVNGGEDSIHPKEDIVRVSKANAQKLLEE